MSHSTLGDLAALLQPGQTYRIRRAPTRRTWLVSLYSAAGDCLDYGEAEDIETAAAQLVATLEAVAADHPLPTADQLERVNFELDMLTLPGIEWRSE